jgi:hypothetical protein
VWSRACTLSQDRTKLLILPHNFSNVMINITSLNEVHYKDDFHDDPDYADFVTPTCDCYEDDEVSASKMP